MPLTGSDTLLSSQMLSLVQAELAAIGKPPDPMSIPNLQAFCSGLAKPICLHIVANAQVAAGIPTSGSPAAQITVAPGVIV